MKEDSLANKVYVELRRKILSNQLLSGMRLKEDYLAKKMEVNRMAVREALTRLLGEKLIVNGKKGGYFVKTMTADDIKEIRELREILEIGALRLVFQKNDERVIEKLEEICNDFTTMVQREYFDGACEADVRFHETLIELSGNKKLMDIYQISNIPLFHQKLGKTQIHLEDYQLTDLEHRQILTALKERKFEHAKEALVKHLIRGEMAVLDFN